MFCQKAVIARHDYAVGHEIRGSNMSTANGKLRIGLFGLFGSGNFGNDGSLEAIIRQLKELLPNAELIAICDGPEIVRKRYGIDAIAITAEPAFGATSLLGKIVQTLYDKSGNAVRVLRSAWRLDAIIMPGTGLLDDFSSGPRGIPLDLWMWCAAARIIGTKIHFVSVGAGPILHPLSRWLMSSAARLAHTRSYRDQGSKTFLARLDVDTHDDPVYPDIAFWLQPPKASPRAQRTDNTLTVGLGVMTYRGWRTGTPDSDAIYERYLTELCAFAGCLISQGHRIRLLIGDASDRETIERFGNLLDEQLGEARTHNVIAADAATLHDVMRQMQEADIVVATRFHNIVCALNTGKPVISVGYAEKNRLLLESAGLDTYAIGIEAFTADALQELFSKAVANLDAIESNIATMLSSTHLQLRSQKIHLANSIGALPDDRRIPARPRLQNLTGRRSGRRPTLKA